ncbi:unnamed protein product [Enterobius vermicularis]|uniref:ENTH domain-containing protein n=1 Tax=Enterobius vermicularis TaxID=51028 RepID=A0A0N4UYD3_ENTVE|nr:unnamed protein product [Enterobius vermicularis]
MSISTIRRQVKNVAYNFSDAQVKVREATSNDPWGPSTALMSEIAELTHNPMSFTEIMSMLWKRLNDHGKNWRHVYKSLVLLDYLIKCGSEKVAQQCRENIYSIETLKDFQHFEDNRDHGMNVRQKAKQMVALLYDEERLKNERTRFMMTRKKFMSGSAVSSNGIVRHSRKADPGPMAINESKKEAERISALEKAPPKMVSGSTLSQSAIDDLLSLGVGQPVNAAQNPWGGPTVDPWAPSPSVTSPVPPSATIGLPSPYPSLTTQAGSNDPWLPASSAVTTTPSLPSDPWSATSTTSSTLEPKPLLPSSSDGESNKQRANMKTPESFLGENSNLVNLDNLMGTTGSSSRPASNPFLTGTGSGASTNPFAAQQRPSPSLSEMMNQSRAAPVTLQPSLNPTPIAPANQQQPTNPFL